MAAARRVCSPTLDALLVILICTIVAIVCSCDVEAETTTPIQAAGVYDGSVSEYRLQLAEPSASFQVLLNQESQDLPKRTADDNNVSLDKDNIGKQDRILIEKQWAPLLLALRDICEDQPRQCAQTDPRAILALLCDALGGGRACRPPSATTAPASELSITIGDTEQQQRQYQHQLWLQMMIEPLLGAVNQRPRQHASPNRTFALYPPATTDELGRAQSWSSQLELVRSEPRDVGAAGETTGQHQRQVTLKSLVDSLVRQYALQQTRPASSIMSIEGGRRHGVFKRDRPVQVGSRRSHENSRVFQQALEEAKRILRARQRQPQHGQLSSLIGHQFTGPTQGRAYIALPGREQPPLLLAPPPPPPSPISATAIDPYMIVPEQSDLEAAAYRATQLGDQLEPIRPESGIRRSRSGGVMLPLESGDDGGGRDGLLKGNGLTSEFSLAATSSNELASTKSTNTATTAAAATTTTSTTTSSKKPPDSQAATKNEDDSMKCNMRKFTYEAHKTDPEGNQCSGIIVANICYGGCDTGEIADWLFPHKKSIHKVCRHGSRARREAHLTHCQSKTGVRLNSALMTGLNRYRYVDALNCVCQKCSSTDTTCLGTMSRPHLQTLVDARASKIKNGGGDGDEDRRPPSIASVLSGNGNGKLLASGGGDD